MIGLQEKVFVDVYLNDKHHMKYFIRNRWYDIKDDDFGKYLLQSHYFLSEEQICFNFNVNENDKILLKRGYALGDLIQLIPVVKYLKKKYNCKFSLWCSPRFYDIMVWFNVFDYVYTKRPKIYDFDQFYILDGLLESDHSIINKERKMHRIKIFEHFFGIDISEHDFSQEA